MQSGAWPKKPEGRIGTGILDKLAKLAEAIP